MKILNNNIFSVTTDGKHKTIKFLFFKFKFNIEKPSRPVILITAPGGIGDYNLCRPYFKYIKQNPKFKNATVLLVIRDFYADFAKVHDKQYFDEIFEFNLREYCKNRHYKKYLNKKINSYNVDICLSLTGYNAENYVGGGISQLLNRCSYAVLLRNIKAKRKIINCIRKNMSTKIKKSKYFNEVIYSDETNLFEAIRIKHLFENLFETEIPDEFSIVEPVTDNKKHLAISIIAQYSYRMYDETKLIQVLNHILEKIDNDTELLFLGAKHDYPVIQNFIDKLKNPAKCKNVAGKYLISQIPDVLRNCEFLLSVESGNVHIAHSVGCKTVCISGSVFYKRFHPYPDNTVTYVYPENLEEILKINPDAVYPENCISVNEVKFKAVTDEIDKLLEELKHVNKEICYD